MQLLSPQTWSWAHSASLSQSPSLCAQGLLLEQKLQSAAVPVPFPEKESFSANYLFTERYDIVSSSWVIFLFRQSLTKAIFYFFLPKIVDLFQMQSKNWRKKRKKIAFLFGFGQYGLVLRTLKVAWSYLDQTIHYIFDTTIKPVAGGPLVEADVDAGAVEDWF